MKPTLEEEFAKRLARLYYPEDEPVLRVYGDWDKRETPPSKEQVREILTADALKDALARDNDVTLEALTRAAVKVLDRAELRRQLSKHIAKKSDRLQKELADDWEVNRGVSLHEALESLGQDD